eukprot:COSAG06_NODE_56_length_27627_cov_106.527136_23_plen_265_part_00
MQQPVAPSQEEGVPPAAATGAGPAQSQAAEEQPPLAAPTPTAAAADDEAPLPLGGDEFPDEALAVVCSCLGPRGLGRLACVSRRFTEPTFTEPGGGGGGGGGAQLLSPIEEGARLQLAADGSGGGGAAVRLGGETWVRALWRVQYRLEFTSCGPRVELSEEGALHLRAERERAAAAMRGAWGRGGLVHLLELLECAGPCCAGGALHAVAACHLCLLSVSLCLPVFLNSLLWLPRAQAPWRQRATACSPRCAPSTRWPRARTTWR